MRENLVINPAIQGSLRDFLMLLLEKQFDESKVDRFLQAHPDFSIPLDKRVFTHSIRTTILFFLVDSVATIEAIEYMVNRVPSLLDETSEAADNPPSPSCIYGVTPLILAAAKGDEEVVKLFLSRGADITLRAENNKTAIQAAAAKGRGSIVLQLLRHIRALNPQEAAVFRSDGLLHHIAAYCDLSTLQRFVELMKEAGLIMAADFSEKFGDTQASVMLYAAASKKEPLAKVRYLVSQGLSVADTDRFGRNMAHLVLLDDSPNIEMLDYLAQNHIELFLNRNTHGQTPLELAETKKSGIRSILPLLDVLKQGVSVAQTELEAVQQLRNRQDQKPITVIQPEPSDDPNGKLAQELFNLLSAKPYNQSEVDEFFSFHPDFEITTYEMCWVLYTEPANLLFQLIKQKADPAAIIFAAQKKPELVNASRRVDQLTPLALAANYGLDNVVMAFLVHIEGDAGFDFERIYDFQRARPDKYLHKASLVHAMVGFCKATTVSRILEIQSKQAVRDDQAAVGQVQHDPDDNRVEEYFKAPAAPHLYAKYKEFGAGLLLIAAASDVEPIEKISALIALGLDPRHEVDLTGRNIVHIWLMEGLINDETKNYFVTNFPDLFSAKTKTYRRTPFELLEEYGRESQKIAVNIPELEQRVAEVLAERRKTASAAEDDDYADAWRAEFAADQTTDLIEDLLVVAARGDGLVIPDLLYSIRNLDSQVRARVYDGSLRLLEKNNATLFMLIVAYCSFDVLNTYVEFVIQDHQKNQKEQQTGAEIMREITLRDRGHLGSNVVFYAVASAHSPLEKLQYFERLLGREQIAALRDDQGRTVLQVAAAELTLQESLLDYLHAHYPQLWSVAELGGLIDPNVVKGPNADYVRWLLREDSLTDAQRVGENSMSMMLQDMGMFRRESRSTESDRVDAPVLK